MSITDELREYAEDWGWLDMPSKEAQDRIEGIADRIDIAHKHAIGYVDDRDPDTMAENGWVRLPKDADGEYVHVGDVMVYADGNTCPLPVVALVPPTVFLTEDGPRYADMCRHYHTPTVEDVLWELLGKITPLMEDDEAVPIVKAYAKKLCLADDGEGQ